MSVADVFNVPTTPAELARWSMLHMILHRSENRAVQAKYHVILPEYVLDPMDTRPESEWFQNHQTMHNNVDQVTGVAQFNLIDVSWSDPAQLIGWIQGHAQLHKQETDILGVFS
jgi:hypothetical protein